MSRNLLSRPAPCFRPRLESLESRWVPASVGTPTENFVDQLYRDILHRAPDPGSAGWVQALDSGRLDRGDVVNDILNSPEGLRTQVNDLYLRFLDRQAEEGGLRFWTDQLRDDDFSNQDLAARIIASPEYYQKAGGTDQAWLNAVYQDVLCRPISAGEVDDRGDDLDDGYEDRVEVAENILESDEAGDTRERLSAISYLRTSTPMTPGLAQNLGDRDDDDDDDHGDDFDDEEAVFDARVLASDQYFQQAQTLATTDFATIPSCDNIVAEPALAPGQVASPTP